MSSKAHRSDSIKNEVKIILLGNCQVGKSSLIIKFIDNKFSFNYISTIGLDFKQKKVTLPSGEIIRVKIFDTAGQERFHSISTSYIKNADAIVLVYDITSQNSFDSVEKWVTNIYNTHGNKVPMTLIGNKSDLEEERKIKTDVGKNKAEEIGIKFYETSCKEGINVNEAFLDLVQQVYTKRNETKNNEDILINEYVNNDENFDLEKNDNDAKSFACC